MEATGDADLADMPMRNRLPPPPSFPPTSPYPWYLPDFPSPWLHPPFGPSPTQATVPLPWPPRILELSTRPGGPCLSIGGSGSPSPCSRASLRRRAGPPPRWEPAVCINKQLCCRHGARLRKEMTTGCYCTTFLNNERAFLENACHLIPLALQTRPRGG